MSLRYIYDTTMGSIAAAIRTKLGVGSSYYPSEMPNAIKNITDDTGEYMFGILNKNLWCGKYIEDMRFAFREHSFTKQPSVCGENVIYLQKAYYKCSSINGTANVGPKVINMFESFYSSSVENAACGDAVTNMANAFRDCKSLQHSACGPKVVDMANCYADCVNLQDANSGESVVNMYRTYYNCKNLQGSAACGPSVIDMANCYYGCSNLIYANCGEKVNNMFQTYTNCSGLLGSSKCGDEVIDLTNTYSNCSNLTYAEFGNNVIYANRSYYNCNNITSASGCVSSEFMDQTFYNCINLHSSGEYPSVKVLYRTFENCKSLEGVAKSWSAINTRDAYRNCRHISSVSISDSVRDSSNMFYLCPQLQCVPQVGYSENIKFMYANSPMVYGDVYLNSPNEVVFDNCFTISYHNATEGLSLVRNALTPRLNIYVRNENTFIAIQKSSKRIMTGVVFTGPQDVVQANRIYKNDMYNVWIYGLFNPTSSGSINSSNNASSNTEYNLNTYDPNHSNITNTEEGKGGGIINGVINFFNNVFDNNSNNNYNLNTYNPNAT